MSEMLKVSSTSEPSATAGALANTIRENSRAELQAIGPKAVNQAVKAITIARGYMAPSGVDLIFVPSFVDVEIDGENKTAMRMLVKTRLPYQPRKDEIRRGGGKREEAESESESESEESLEVDLPDESEEEEGDWGSSDIHLDDDILDV